MSIPKQHHMIPRVYLEKFIESDNRITVKSKRRGTVLRPYPDKALTRYHYYSQPVDGLLNADQALESTLFHDIEDGYLDLINKIQSCPDEVDPAVFLTTMISMRARSPSFREVFEVGLAQLVDNVRRKLPKHEFPPIPKDSPVDFDQVWESMTVSIDPDRSIHAMLYYVKNYFGFLDDLEIKLCKPPKGRNFLTSDNPVIWYDTGYGIGKPRIYPSQFSKNTRLAFPLTNELAVIGKKSFSGQFSMDLRSRSLSKRLFREVNEMQVACCWDEVVGLEKLSNKSWKRFSSVCPHFELDSYDPESNAFSIGGTFLGELLRKHKYKYD